MSQKECFLGIFNPKSTKTIEQPMLKTGKLPQKVATFPQKGRASSLLEAISLSN
jgi:hypothetical protein